MNDPPARLSAALSDRYRIERELGEGGMATVYLAEDLKHDRKVALKVLKPELAAVVGADRFLAEIRTTANLQHPHILPLFDSGTAEGFLYYVMPYVEGESLRERLDRERQLPVDEAVALAAKVAGALHAAHGSGVVHRDVKPANILLTGGEPLVADFGIALAVQEAGGGRLTETGLSMGTPYYMSPEQATADRTPDARSDVYSLGCVLYEMLAGEPPFAGSSAQAVLGRILTQQAPRVTRERSSVPAHVEAVVLRALEKLPADRFASAGDFAGALGDPTFRHGSVAGASEGTVSSSSGRPRGRPWLGVFGLAAMTFVAGTWLGGRGEGRAAVRDLGLPYQAPLAGGSSTPSFAVSADGSFVVYEARTEEGRQLWYRSLVGSEARPIPGTEGASQTPRISPDGRRVAFQVDDAVRVVPVDGGTPTTVAEVENSWGGGWLDDGLLFYAEQDGRILRWIDPDTGPVRTVGVTYCQMPSVLSASEVLCAGGSEKFAYVYDLDGEPAQRRDLMQLPRGGGPPQRVRGSHFRLVDGEYLVYTSVDGTIMATRFVDRDSLLVSRPVPLVPEVRRQTYTGAGEFDLTDDGTLVYAPGPNTEVGRLVQHPVDGRAQVRLPGGPAAHLRFSLAPDGRRLASVVEGLTQQELRVYDLATGSHETLAEAAYVSWPAWAPDGGHLIYGVGESSRSLENLLQHRLNSTEPPTVLHRGGPGVGWSPVQYLSPDSLVVRVEGSPAEILIIDPARPEEIRASLGMNANFVQISPDHRWIAWQEHNQESVFLEPWPTRDRRWTVATNVIEPQWLSDNSLVFFNPDPTSMGSGRVYRLWLDSTLDPPTARQETLVDDPRRADTPGWSLAIGPDDAVVYLQMPERMETGYFRVVPGWVREMKRAVDEASR